MPVVGHEHRANVQERVHVATKRVARGQYRVQCTALYLVTLDSAAEIE